MAAVSQQGGFCATVSISQPYMVNPSNPGYKVEVVVMLLHLITLLFYTIVLFWELHYKDHLLVLELELD